MSKRHHRHQCPEPANTKLRLLENLESDDGDGDGFTNSSKDDDLAPFASSKNLGPTVLMEDDKMSAILY